MIETLAEGLASSAVDWKTLHKNYNPLLNLVRELIGIIPNCDPVLEIWEPGFRTYNLLVPNMFNLPATIFGNRSFKSSMGLAMYASSKAACAYCTAHTCSFALRRGARADAIAGSRTEKEQAVITMAERLAHIPSTLTMADVEKVRQYFSESETKWLVHSISMMGFLNKFMNAMGVELEQEAINDTAALLSETVWQPGLHKKNGYSITAPSAIKTDNLFTYLRVMRHAPGAVFWEKKWTNGVPSKYSEVADYLKKCTGYSFPILGPVKEPRVLRTLTAALRDNLDAQLSISGIKCKVYSGYIFSTIVQNEFLKAEIRNLSVQINFELTDHIAEVLTSLADTEIPVDISVCKNLISSIQEQLRLNEKEAVVIVLSIAASHSPAQINNSVIELVLKVLEPAVIVEVIVWLSVLQLLNRMNSYFKVVNQD